MTGGLIKGETDTDMHTGSRLYEDEGRNWDDIVTSHGKARDYQQMSRARGET